MGRELKTQPPASQLGARPRMPAGLDKGAQSVWRRTVPRLWARGLYDPLDGDVIVQYCVARAMADELKADLAQYGKIGRKKGAVVASPLWAMWMQEEEFALKLAGVIGLTSRSRLRSPAPAKKEERTPRPLVWDVGDDDVVDVTEEGGDGIVT